MVVTVVPWRVDARIIGAISAAHGASHFFQLSLAPLFPLRTNASVRQHQVSHSQRLQVNFGRYVFLVIFLWLAQEATPATTQTCVYAPQEIAESLVFPSDRTIIST
jgi:hypothetical protein